MYVITLNKKVPSNRREAMARLGKETDRAIQVIFTETHISGRLNGEETSTEIWLPKSLMLAWGPNAICFEPYWIAEKQCRPGYAVTRRYGLEGRFISESEMNTARKRKAQDFAEGRAKLNLGFEKRGHTFLWASEIRK